MAEAVPWYRDGAGLILAGDAAPLDAVGENIRNFTFLLILFPFFWTPFGVIGAEIGRVGRARLGRLSPTGRCEHPRTTRSPRSGG
ncbi:MAG: hypothetical protein ACRDKW_05120 [Actinomycetota bacterium]